MNPTVAALMILEDLMGRSGGEWLNKIRSEDPAVYGEIFDSVVHTILCCVLMITDIEAIKKILTRSGVHFRVFERQAYQMPENPTTIQVDGDPPSTIELSFAPNGALLQLTAFE